MRHSLLTIEKARKLRTHGKTYGEIRKLLQLNIPKSTLSWWCKDVVLPLNYSKRIAKLNLNNLNKARLIAHEINKVKREEFLEKLDKLNLPVSKEIENLLTSKIALAMLCLGEASKYNSKTSFYLGSSDPRIIVVFLELLKKCFDFDLEKVRCTIQCRADQNVKELEEYWMDVTKIPKRLFYKTRKDPRTVGKHTKKISYKGVLRVNYLDTRVQLELESLSKLVYNQLAK